MRYDELRSYSSSPRPHSFLPGYGWRRRTRDTKGLRTRVVIIHLPEVEGGAGRGGEEVGG